MLQSFGGKSCHDKELANLLDIHSGEDIRQQMGRMIHPNTQMVYHLHIEEDCRRDSDNTIHRSSQNSIVH